MLIKKTPDFADFRANIYRQAKFIGCCDKFKGDESIEDFVNLARTLEGFSFCDEHRFPSLAAWREFDRLFDAEKYGVYVDRQDVRLTNPKHPILVGRTMATLKFDDIKQGVQMVTLLGGAKATVTASGWAVVRIHCSNGSVAIRQPQDKAIIL